MQGEVPKYLVRLANPNHRADVHKLDHIQRRPYHGIYKRRNCNLKWKLSFTKVYPASRGYIFTVWADVRKVAYFSHTSSYLENVASAHRVTKVKRIIPEKITQLVFAILYRHKKRCTNCQGHEEMNFLLKQKLKEQLQRTRQTARNKERRTIGLEAIGKLCGRGGIIYYSST